MAASAGSALLIEMLLAVIVAPDNTICPSTRTARQFVAEK